MNFIEEHYVMILIILIISIMAVIGYLADKTDFGRKKISKPKKEKKVKNENIEKPQKIEIDAKGINDISKDINKSEKIFAEENSNITNTDDNIEETKPEENSNSEVKQVQEEEDIWKF